MCIICLLNTLKASSALSLNVAMEALFLALKLSVLRFVLSNHLKSMNQKDELPILYGTAGTVDPVVPGVCCGA